MQRADAAISARLLKVVPRNHQRAVYRYRVQRVYKSGGGIEPGKVISVNSAQGSAACGLPTGVGRRYGLLLSHSEQRLGQRSMRFAAASLTVLVD